jgi:nucleoid DNA-binding protein
MARINLPTLTSEIMLHDAFANTSKAQVEAVLRFTFDTIANHVTAGDEVAIPSIGKFSKFTSSVTEKSKPKFSAAKAWKDAVNA